MKHAKILNIFYYNKLYYNNKNTKTCSKEVEWQKDRFMQVKNTYGLKHTNNPESIATKMYTCMMTNFPLLALPKTKKAKGSPINALGLTFIL